MFSARSLLASILLASASLSKGQAQEASAVRTTNALNDLVRSQRDNDLARSQRDQAGSMRRIESIQRDQARADRNARDDAEVTSRGSAVSIASAVTRTEDSRSV